MQQQTERQERKGERKRAPQRPSDAAKEPILIDVVVRQPQRDCPIYAWDHERSSLRLVGYAHAMPGLPADLAAYSLEGDLELPVLLLGAFSNPPGTRVQARLLGAYSCVSEVSAMNGAPIQGWIGVAAVQADIAYASSNTLEQISPDQQTALLAYTRKQSGEMQPQSEIIVHSAEETARVLREARVLIKRTQRASARRKNWGGSEVEEKPVAWRAVEGLSAALRLEVQRNALLAQDEQAPHAQAEQLIRFVPQRFQHALTSLLLDDERLLAFVERPLLRHRTGLLGLQQWRSNEGLFLLTDRQALWLRDFLAPGNSFLEGGYIARSLPLERLRSVAILPPGTAPDELASRLDVQNSPYHRMIVESESAAGSELLAIEFPANAEVEKALARIAAMLRAFLPQSDGEHDLRLRRLPFVEMWLPQGAEAEQLAGLGGIVSPSTAHLLEQQLAEAVKESGAEVLVSALVPALEEFKTPARLIALTHHALLVIDDREKGPRTAHGQLHRYELSAITSVQLRYSLLGSGLSLFLPQVGGNTQQVSLPFHSPAIAWFLPLFSRLRLLLSGPYRSG